MILYACVGVIGCGLLIKRATRDVRVVYRRGSWAVLTGHNKVYSP